jgi:hypothetical protein
VGRGLRAGTQDIDTDAGMIYQHATAEADQAIAEAVSARVVSDRKTAAADRKKAARKARWDELTKRPEDPEDGATGALSEVG